MTGTATELREHAEALDSATDLGEVGAALRDVASHWIGASSLCFIPFGIDGSSMADGTFFHERYSSERIQEALFDHFPMTQRELGSGDKTATERLFDSRMRVVDLNAMFGPEGLERTQTFNEFWRPFHIQRQVFAPLVADRRALGYMCVGRAASEPKFQPRELERFEGLSRRTLNALRRLGYAGGDSKHGLLEALRHIPVACALFDAAGRLLWVSTVAERELGLRWVDVQMTRLVNSTAALHTWLGAAKRALAAGQSTTQEGDLVLQRIDCDAGHFMLATRNRSSGPAGSQRVERIRRHWRLTAREAEVLRELTEGCCNKEIAVNLCCSTRTVEVHVSSLLLKSGCSSRTALLARLWAEA